MTPERFKEIKDAIYDNMQSDLMIGEILAWAEAQQTIIDTQRQTIEALQG